MVRSLSARFRSAPVLRLEDAANHSSAEVTGLLHGLPRAGFRLWPLRDQALELLVEEARHDVGRMRELTTVGIGDGDLVQYPLRDHVAIDAVGRQVFHVAVEQAGALAVEHPVAVANDSPHCGPGSVERPLANALRAGSQVLVNVGV